MKIGLVSDLHFEFDVDLSLIGSLYADELCDVLVLAGDIGTEYIVHDALEKFCVVYPKLPILYVPGNHEFWHTAPAARVKEFEAISKKHLNFRFLNAKRPLNLLGRRWHGHTGWFPATPLARMQQHAWSDFYYIKDANAFIYREHRRWEQYLRKYLQEGDIVVSHMLPSTKCVTDKWLSVSTNCFFVSDLDSLILERKPALWMFGHTHDSVDTIVGSTRCVCNPRGYWPKYLNFQFKDPKVIEI